MKIKRRIAIVLSLVVALFGTSLILLSSLGKAVHAKSSIDECRQRLNILTQTQMHNRLLLFAY